MPKKMQGEVSSTRRSLGLALTLFSSKMNFKPELSVLRSFSDEFSLHFYFLNFCLEKHCFCIQVVLSGRMKV